MQVRYQAALRPDRERDYSSGDEWFCLNHPASFGRFLQTLWNTTPALRAIPPRRGGGIAPTPGLRLEELENVLDLATHHGVVDAAVVVNSE